jgi:RNA polymerase sigma-70 factor (ECF subfamily)
MKDQRPDIDVLAELPGMRRYALALTRNPADAEDLVHDALVRALERNGQFRSGHGLRPWLLSILHNRFVDGLRARRAEKLRDSAFGEAIPAALPPSQEASLMLDDTRRAFAALPDDQRAALHLVAVEGLPYDEAAATLRIPVGTLVSRISRARARLRAADERRPGSNVIQLKTVGGSDGHGS